MTERRTGERLPYNMKPRLVSAETGRIFIYEKDFLEISG